MAFISEPLKIKWLDALRSGEYRQGQGRLRYRMDDEQQDQYCCLGVLCDISLAAKWLEGTVDWDQTGEDGSLTHGFYYTAEYVTDDDTFGNPECAFLPESVSREIGLWGHYLDELPDDFDSTEWGESPERAHGDLSERSIDSFLVSMNDSWGKSLSDIADFIERYL